MPSYTGPMLDVVTYVNTADGYTQEIADKGTPIVQQLESALESINQIYDTLASIDTSDYPMDDFDDMGNPEDVVENFMDISDEDTDVCYESWEVLMNTLSDYLELLNLVDETLKKIDVESIQNRLSYLVDM